MSAKRHVPPQRPLPRPAAAHIQQAQAFFAAGVAHHQHGRLHEAGEFYGKALALTPDVPEALSNLGCILKDLGRASEAIPLFDRAILLSPRFADAHSNRGNALIDLARPADALASFDQAVALKPSFPAAWSNRACALLDLGHAREALQSSERAIALDPRFARAHNNRGNALKKLGRVEEAVAAYEIAVKLQPVYAEAFHNLGLALLSLKRLEDALASLETAYSQDASYPFLLGECIHTRMKLCRWDGLDGWIERCIAATQRGEKAITPFALTSLVDDPALQRRASQTYARARLPHAALAALPTPAGPANGRIRIGYFSADFYNHASAYLIAEMLRLHDRSRFEITAFSFGPPHDDEMRLWVKANVERFIDARERSDAEVAQLARESGIDIAVDLGGYTRGSRPGVFAWRCAPVQATWLGYPGTLGLPYIDYLMADDTVIAPGHRDSFSESIAMLPDGYFPVTSLRRPRESTITRAEAGLPDEGFVYCCFNAVHKILPDMFRSWMRILDAVPHSVLWLFADNTTASNNLREQARHCGVDPARIVFAPRVPSQDHLARHRLADLFLDTLPYNAHTTGTDALWMGLPMLACMGHSFPSRVAASLLKSAGLPELITHSMAEYEQRAIALGKDAQGMQELREKLERNRATQPFFDAPRFARGIESVYEAMLARYRAGLPPADIAVDG